MINRFFLFTVVALFSGVSFGSTPAYQPSGEIKIGGEGGWDYLTVDSATHRLYLSQATRIVVIDIAQNKIIGEIKDTMGVHGIALATDLGLGFSSNGKEGKVAVIDLKTLKILEKIAVGENPDAISYDAKSKKVFVFNGRSKSLSVIDAVSKKVVQTVDLPGKPEFSVVDSDAGRVYVNIEDTSEALAIDTHTFKIQSKWKLAPCETPTGLAIDLVGKRFFSVCENEKMVVFDISKEKVISSLKIGAKADAVSFDPAQNMLIASAGGGEVTIADVDTQGQLSLVQNLSTALGSKTIAMDLATRRIYLPAAQFEKPKVTGARPTVVAGTLKVLIYGPKK